MIRIKFFVKTEEELTSCEVAVTKVRKPLVSLFYKNYANNNYKRRIFSEDGLVITRLECSFYIDRVYKPKCYREIVDLIFPGSEENVVNAEWTRLVKVEDYFRALHLGEKYFGRTILLEEQKLE